MEIVSLVRGGFFTGKTDPEIQTSLDDNRRAIDEANALGAPMVCPRVWCGARTVDPEIAFSDSNRLRNPPALRRST